MKTVQDRSQKMELVKWQTLEWFQPEGFADMYEKGLRKLLNSIKKNGIIDPLDIWEKPDGTRVILDGHHRQMAFIEYEKRGMGKIPELLNAVFYHCKDEKEATRIILAKRSSYSEVQGQGVYEMLEKHEVPHEEVMEFMEIPGIDAEKFEAEFYTEPNLPDTEKEIDILETQNECPKCGYKW